MNAHLQSRLSLGLIAACVLFALLVFAFWMHVGRGYSWLPPNAEATPTLPKAGELKSKPFSMPGFGIFAEITQRPLFAADRKPIPPDAAGAEPEKPEPPPVPLQVALTGVIITPELKLAMLHDNTTNQSVSLREGMPLPGNQSGWTLVEIHPRKVVFTDTEEQTQEVELTVAGQSGGPQPPQRRTAPGQARGANAAANPKNDEQQTAAEQLRARIEERRRELREKAAQARQKQAEAGK